MQYVDVLNPWNPVDMQLAAHALEQAGVRYIIVGALALESGQASALGNSGARIQVHIDDLPLALETLKAAGYWSEESNTPSHPQWVEFWDEKTKDIPILGWISFPYRLLVILTLITLVVLALIAAQ